MISEDYKFIFEMFSWRDRFICDNGARRNPPLVYRHVTTNSCDSCSYTASFATHLKCRPSVFRVLDGSDWKIVTEAFEANWHRAYVIIAYLSRYVLLILQADTKTYAIVYTTLDASESVNNHARGFYDQLFRRSNGHLLSQGWTAGPIGPFRDLLKMHRIINKLEATYTGIYLVYCVYFILLDVPVFFDATDSTLRENLAYHCIVGHLPF